MDILRFENLSFTYPNGKKKVLSNVTLGIKEGDFVVVCGASGCGKTTLLKLLKKELAPYGELEGAIIFEENNLKELSLQKSAGDIGFVLQNPHRQIVTDKVWHELSFGLENLGVEQKDMRRRVGEMASYFGIGSWYHQETATLSGGQKQLLNLAAVMVMQPKVLILDEPTSQLDPIAAQDFIATLKKINQELGTTIIMAEHRLEDVFPIANQVLVMDAGQVLAYAPPREASRLLKNHPVKLGFPSSVRIFDGLDIDDTCPLTVKEGRDFLRTHFMEKKGTILPVDMPVEKEILAVEAKNLWFRYEKTSPDVLRGVGFKVYQGEIYSILGGNGTGKTTLLQVLASLDKAYKGGVKINGRKLKEYQGQSLYRKNLALLPQNPEQIFLKETVEEDYQHYLKVLGFTKEEAKGKMDTIVEKFHLEALLSSHPYDLSGGEQQKCALGKLLLGEPTLIFLDEPTKGLDAISKENLLAILKELQRDNLTVLMVTHDVEFAAMASDRCGLFFDGEMISEDTPNVFFSGNNFYTTAASRISRQVFENTVVCQEVIALCRA